MLSDNIQRARKEKGWSQEELAVRLNVVRQTISKWERGISVPDADMLIHLAALLDVPVSTLLGVEERNWRADALADELAALNAELAKGRRRNALYIEANRKRNLILFFCFAALFICVAANDPRVSLALCGSCALAAVVILYRNLALLTQISTDDLHLGTLKLTTIVNIGFLLVALTAALLSATGTLVFSERSERLFAMCFIALIMVFTGLIAPRLPFQRHTGLRLPWTVSDEETWILAHRILGLLSLPLALLYVAASLTLDDLRTVSLVAIALWVGIPSLLSWVFYWKKFHVRL